MKLTNKNDIKIDTTLTTLAMLGDPEALNELASIYYTKGTEEDLKMAFKLWQQSVKEEDLTAMNNVALCYLYGYGTDKDTKKAIHILEELADKFDCADSMTELGDIYYFGIGTDVDYNKSFVYYMEAYKRDKTQLRSKFGIAYDYYSGRGVEKNHDIAFNLLHELVEKDKYEEAIYYFGLCYYDAVGTEKNYEKALFYFNQAFESHTNIKKASSFLAKMYLNGIGTQVDIQKAIEYYNISYDGKNDHKINYMLGLIYSGKFGEYQNHKKAEQYFNDIEIDLCLQIIYYIYSKDYYMYEDILAVLKEMNVIVSSDLEIEKMNTYHNTYFDTTNDSFYSFQKQSYLEFFEIYSNKLKCLANDEYLYIVKRFKQKVEKCLEDDHLTDILKTCSDDDFIFFAKCIVESYHYSTMNDYIQNLLNSGDNFTLLYVSKLCLNQEVKKTEVIDWTKILETTLHKMKDIYDKYYPTDMEFQALFQLAEQTKDSAIASYILDFNGMKIFSDDRPSRIDIDLKGYDILVKHKETDIVRKALETVMQKILGYYVLKRKFSDLEYTMLTEYPMSDSEQHQIALLGLDDKIENLTKTSYSLNCIKYINRIGYIWIEETVIMDLPSKWNLYLAPTEDLNQAKEQISKILDEKLSLISQSE